MEFLQALQWDKFHLDAVIIILVIAGGFFQKRYLFNIKLADAWKTFLVGFIFTSIYLLLLVASHQFKTEKLVDYFISFCVATSCYDLVLKPIIKKIFPEADNS